MQSASSSERPRKRRAINACTSCRASKVRCDGKRPCQRCERNDADCQYSETARDETVLRIEKLEAEIVTLRQEVSVLGGNLKTAPPMRNNTSTSLSQFVESTIRPNAVDSGLITWEQAELWFRSFFSGSQYVVPLFCTRYDTMTSVSSRSVFLFDAITSVGCRAEEGFDSPIHRQLQARLRDHLTSLLINANSPCVEDVQALTLMAAYSDNSYILIALALRFAIQLSLPSVVEQLVAHGPSRGRVIGTDEKELYRLTRVWYGVCNLELFFSLDGGKLPRMILHVSPRKVRSLLNHSESTLVDIRLLSQVELNLIRSEAYHKLAGLHTDPGPAQDEARLRAVINDTSLELSLWLDEWINLVSSDASNQQRENPLQNLHIQHQWALMTLHLKAVATTGIENIAIMTDLQKDSVRKAKDAAVCHLHHVLDASSTHSPHSEGQSTQGSLYLSTFRWTLDYVWAKCAFSVLLVLRLAILLRDPVPSIMDLLRDAHRLLEELKRVTVGHIAYFQILQTSIEKCEAALIEYMAQQNAAPGQNPTSPEGTGVAEDEFQGYVPNEFIFDWDFPGLNLKHMPLGWQEYFIDIDGLF
ncbi:hypothetical protein FB567DRAFT_541604 [Paraphoma chrysanthemicola]|uniref:Zn(2)-C6 fungal-type domain-containing protein n=1 Tax=Paraphoma chrysanthemicola TaxID=798071 RepID=A0A8K0QRL9_9PLEO|nr:hypothetical protein FB567DRAFT_541604 [Paraphoma chrysanthemicola]